MYCVKCGVELSEGQKKCPLCETRVYHPDFIVEGKETYPKNNTPPDKFERKGLMFIFTAIFLIPFVLCLVCDLSINSKIVWSGYAMGAIALLYIIAVLPFWLRHPSPIIFVPCSFAGVLLYLAYVNLQTNGDWFMTFAFPTVGAFAIIKQDKGKSPRSFPNDPQQPATAGCNRGSGTFLGIKVGKSKICSWGLFHNAVSF
jgi:hypothetical protein